MRLPADPSMLHGVREMVGSVLELHGWPADRVDDARIVVSELVTNAVVHAGTEVEIRVEVDTDARLSVTDYVPERHPKIRPHDPGQVGGLGLKLVDQLSERWGVATSDQAKTVWCELSPHSRAATPRSVRQA
jgi:anti-sigma regulatory factor (Ser/Thr protein kinase)